MNKPPIKVAITGAAGAIGYQLVFRIASGQLFGPEQPVALSLIEIEQVLPSLGGIAMELDDCAFPLLTGVTTTASLDEGFKGVNWCILVGGMPRKQGMERKDLLNINGKIFIGQGQAIAKHAAPDVRVHVVANPANTNAWICMKASKLPGDRFFAMTRLDENRARTFLARKAGVAIEEVTNLAIWGNHSSTQFPDFTNARVGGKKAPDAIQDKAWLEGAFIADVQQRGAAVIKARGASSAGSAANAAIDSIRSILDPTPKGEWHSVAVHSDGNPYGLEKDLIASFPVRSDGKKLQIVPEVPLGAFAKGKIEASFKELAEERAMVKELVG